MITSAVILAMVFISKKWGWASFFQRWHLAKLELDIKDCWEKADENAEKRNEEMTFHWIEKAEEAQKKRNDFVKNFPLSLGPKRRGRG